MTHRISPGGSLRIDRRFAGVGRIALASGTKDRKKFEKLDMMLTELHEDGYTDVLRGIKNRSWTLQEVYQAKRTGCLPYLASELVLLRNLWNAVAEWMPQSAPKEGSCKRYEVSFTSLKRSGVLPPTARVADLRCVDWIALKRRWKGGPADWNRMRAAVSRFLTVTLGDKYHPCRREVMNTFPRAKEPSGRVPDLSPESLWKIVRAAPDHVQPAYVTLAVTGMRVGEYLDLEETDLLPHTRSVRVPGTKTAASNDVIRIGPKAWKWVKRAVPAPVRYKWLYTHWKRACEAEGVTGLTLHDLRHFYGQQLIEAGRSEVSVQSGLRHADARTTRRYTRQKDRGENARTMDAIVFPKQANRAPQSA